MNKNTEINEHQAKYLNYVGIFKRYFKTDINSYVAVLPGQRAALATVKNFITSLHTRIDKGDCMAFCGSPGSGKTHLGISIIRECFSRKLSSKYLTMPELIQNIRATYKNYGGTIQQLIKDLSELNVLVIDEVGVNAGKEDTTVLFDIIDTRYRHQLPTIIISNLSQENLTDYIGVRTMERIEEGDGIIIAFDWKSFRRSKT